MAKYGKIWGAARRGYNPNRVVTLGLPGADEHPGEYRSPPNGPGPGRGPYPWKTSAPPEALDFSGGGWLVAPGDSHLQDFRFVYGIDGPWTASGYQHGRGGIRIHRDTAMSFLQIRFDDGGYHVSWSIPGTQYTAERLELVSLFMESSNDPGAFIWSDLHGKGGSVRWPYDTNR